MNIRNIYEIPIDKYIIMYYGYIGNEQGLQVLLQAYNNLKAEIDNIALMLCGNGDSVEQFKNYVIENNLSDVKFITEIEPTKKHIYLAQSDVIVFPGNYVIGEEGKYELSIYEAVKYSIPVIANSKIAGVRDIIVDWENGVSIEDGSVDALHAALGTILTNPILLKRMRENNHK